MNGEATLYAQLTSYTDITDLLSLVNGYPAIAVGVKEPDTWLPEHTTLSIYNAAGMDARDKEMVVELTVNCRSGTENEVKTLAQAVVNSLNEAVFLDGRGGYYCQYGGIIQPADELDSYNLPLSVTMKAGEVVD